MPVKTKIEAVAPEATVEPAPAPKAEPKRTWGPTHKLVAALGGGFLVLQALGMVANHSEAKAAPVPPPAKHIAHRHKHVAPKAEAKPTPIVVQVQCPAAKAEPTFAPEPKEEPIY